jgi:hypothetical protein
MNPIVKATHQYLGEDGVAVHANAPFVQARHCLCPPSRPISVLTLYHMISVRRDTSFTSLALLPLWFIAMDNGVCRNQVVDQLDNPYAFVVASFDCSMVGFPVNGIEYMFVPFVPAAYVLS